MKYKVSNLWHETAKRKIEFYEFCDEMSIKCRLYFKKIFYLFFQLLLFYNWKIITIKNPIWRRFLYVPLLYHKFWHTVLFGQETYIHFVAHEINIIRKVLIFIFFGKYIKNGPAKKNRGTGQPYPSWKSPHPKT